MCNLWFFSPVCQSLQVVFVSVRLEVWIDDSSCCLRLPVSDVISCFSSSLHSQRNEVESFLHRQVVVDWFACFEAFDISRSLFQTDPGFVQTSIMPEEHLQDANTAPGHGQIGHALDNCKSDDLTMLV